MQPSKSKYLASKIEQLFVWTGYSIISIAGLYLAVVAHQVERLDAWAVAYLVLIAGVAQNALGKGLAHLTKQVSYRQAIVVFMVFNTANLLVVVGRFQAWASLVVMGMVGIVASTSYASWLTRGVKYSRALVGYYIVLASVALGSVAGVVLTFIFR